MMKRTLTLPFAAMLLVVLGSASSFAIPSLSGPTGVVATPTAMVAPAGDLQGAISYQSMEVAGLGGYEADEDLSAWSLQALAGVTDRAELWAAYTSVRDGDDTRAYAIGGKLQLTKEPEDDVTLAIGGGYGVTKDMVVSTAMYDPELQEWVGENVVTDVTTKSAYIVATKDLSPLGGEGWEWGAGAGTKMLGSVGIMYLSSDPDVGDSESLTKPFVNLEFIGAGGTTLGLEYRWKDSDLDAKAVFSAVLRHPMSDIVTAEVGTTNAGPGGFGLDDQDWFVRLAVTLPMGGASY